MQRILLAHSGSFTASAALAWLVEQPDVEVVTLTLDVGQGQDLAAVRERAIALGAVRAHVLDTREEFAQSFVLPALQAGVFDTEHRHVAEALVHTLVAKRLVELARMESASAVAHAASPQSTGERVLGTALRWLDPALEIMAPGRDRSMSLEELVTFGRLRGLHPPATGERTVKANVWARQVTGPVTSQSFVLTRDAAEAPAGPAFVDVEFHHGVPVRTNGLEMSLLELIESLETIAGAHGVGRRLDGDLTIEAPAAVVLHEAHRSLAARVLGADVAALNAGLASTYVRLISTGRWFSETREAIDAFVQIQQRPLTGVIRVKLERGACSAVPAADERTGTGGSSTSLAVA